MKIKKVIILLLVLFIPFFCYAKECNKNDIKIESIELSDIRGNAEELSSSNNNNNKINLNTKMNVIGDSLTYKVVVKNTSNSDYTFDKNMLSKDYLSYDITYEDNSNIIKPNEEKVIYLRLSYDNKPEIEKLVNGVLKGNEQISFDLTKETEFINPETGNKILLSLIYLLILVIISFYLIKKKKPTFMLLLLLTIIPYIVNASCTCVTTLDINLSLEIDRKEAIFLPGQEVNIKMKELAGDNTSTSTTGYGFKDQNITAIKKSEVEPIESNKEEKNIVSTVESSYSIYMWYEEETIYWWSEDNTPALNEDASYMFFKIVNLSVIEGLKKFDSSSATTLAYFLSWSGLLNIDSLANWNTSNVEYMAGLFGNAKSLVTSKGIETWDVSKVKSINYMFVSCYELEEVDLSGWHTDSLETMYNTFGMWNDDGMPYYDSKLRNITLSEKFNTSNVTTMYGLLANNGQIEDYSFLQYFDTSNVTDMQQMFQHNHNLQDTKYFQNWDTSMVTTINGLFQYSSIKSLNYLSNWDVSKVTDMKFTFRGCSNLNSLSGIENWNVYSVKDFIQMFSKNSNLNDANAINNWHIQNIATFDSMFYQTPTHPEFMKIEGTWNDQGTFIPN